MRLDERDREVEKLQTIIENVTKERDQLLTDHHDSSALKDSAIDDLSARAHKLEEELRVGAPELLFLSLFAVFLSHRTSPFLPLFFS